MKSFRPACAALLAAAAVAPATGLAHDRDDDAMPDLELLEYLGSWQKDDEDWFLDAELDGKVEQHRPKRKRDGDENEDD